MRNGLTLTRLILREVQRAKLNTALCLFTVMAATALLVAMVAIGRASVDATRIMMKQMGFNLLITPQDVDPARYQALDFQKGDMPEDYVQRLASSTALAQHFVGKLQKTTQVDGCTVVLTGVLPEVPKVGTQMQPMPTAFVIAEGEVKVAYAAARALGLQAGARMTIMGKTFVVNEILTEVGVIPEDIRIYAHLHDVQALLERPGRINAIDALACYCPVDVKDVVAALRQTVEGVLPDVNVQPYHSILLARQQQRVMVYRLELAALAIVMAGSAIAIWGLTYLNVRNRRREIGVLRALGVPDSRIAALFIGKILAYSLAGAIAGSALGTLAGNCFNVTGGSASFPPAVLAALIAATPLAATMFGLPPIVSGLLQEPTEVLEEGES